MPSPQPQQQQTAKNAMAPSPVPLSFPLSVGEHALKDGPPVPESAGRDHPTAGRAPTPEDNEADPGSPTVARKRRRKRQRVLPAWGALQLTCNPKLLPPCNFSDDKHPATDRGRRQPPPRPLRLPITIAAAAREPREGAARRKYRGWVGTLDPELQGPDPGRRDAELCRARKLPGLGCDSAAAHPHTAASSLPSMALDLPSEDKAGAPDAATGDEIESDSDAKPPKRMGRLQLASHVWNTNGGGH